MKKVISAKFIIERHLLLTLLNIHQNMGIDIYGKLYHFVCFDLMHPTY